MGFAAPIGVSGRALESVSESGSPQLRKRYNGIVFVKSLEIGKPI